MPWQASQVSGPGPKGVSHYPLPFRAHFSRKLGCRSNPGAGHGLWAFAKQHLRHAVKPLAPEYTTLPVLDVMFVKSVHDLTDIFQLFLLKFSFKSNHV